MTDRENSPDNNNQTDNNEPTSAADNKRKKILKIIGILALIFIALPILIFGTCILLISGSWY